MTISIQSGDYSIYRYPPNNAIHAQTLCSQGFISITRGEEELSILCRSGTASGFEKEESGWALLKVEGPLEFSMTGLIASISKALAEAGIPIFVVSSFDTDYFLVKRLILDSATSCLRAAGFDLRP